MILKLLLNLFGTIISVLINMVNGIMPSNGLNNSLGDIITSILSITQQAYNFMYLIFGETLFIIMPIITVLITLKYTVIPIVQIMRSFFINSNE